MTSAPRSKLALVFMSAGQFDEAEKRPRDSGPFSEPTSRQWSILSSHRAARQELDDAEKRLRGIKAYDKAGFHLALAAAALRKQDLASAMSEVKQALSLDPGSVEAHLALAKLYWLSAINRRG